MGAFIFVSVLILIVCILLILVVLVQNSKGGGLASNFSSNNQIMGVRKTTDFLEKFTWGCAIALLILSMISIFVIPKNVNTTVKSTELQDQIDKNSAPSTNNYQAPPEKK
ncbi:MAG: preprotein translocase subunit SecG [Bacteroidales bacterium]